MLLSCEEDPVVAARGSLWLRIEARSRRVSMASVAREAPASSFGMHRRPRGIEDFSFVGSGESEQGELSPVSERHDEAMEEAFM